MTLPVHVYVGSTNWVQWVYFKDMPDTDTCSDDPGKNWGHKCDQNALHTCMEFSMDKLKY